LKIKKGAGCLIGRVHKKQPVPFLSPPKKGIETAAANLGADRDAAKSAAQVTS